MEIDKGIAKDCRYHCGKKVYWSKDDKYKDMKLRWVEADTDIYHGFKRCAELLKEQGKDVGVLKKK